MDTKPVNALHILIAGALVAVAACTGRAREPMTGAPIAAEPPRAWIDAQVVACGEIRGRLMLKSTGEPLGSAFVTIEGTRAGVRTDDDGVFELRRDKVHPLPGVLRVRRIGIEPVLIELSDPVDNRGYVIEIVAVPGGFHGDTYTVVTIRRPAACARAT